MQNSASEQEETTYKSSLFLRLLKGDYNPFTPNTLIVNDHFIEYKRRNWHLVSVDSTKFHFQNVVGVDIDKHLIGSSLSIITSGSGRIMVNGYSKSKANQFKKHCSEHIAVNSQKSTTETLASAIATAVGNSSGQVQQLSVADELKKIKSLLDDDIITQEEYSQQKAKLLA